MLEPLQLPSELARPMPPCPPTARPQHPTIDLVYFMPAAAVGWTGGIGPRQFRRQLKRFEHGGFLQSVVDASISWPMRIRAPVPMPSHRAKRAAKTSTVEPCSNQPNSAPWKPVRSRSAAARGSEGAAAGRRSAGGSADQDRSDRHQGDPFRPRVQPALNHARSLRSTAAR